MKKDLVILEGKDVSAWEGLLSEEEKKVIEMSGYGLRRGGGKNPVLVIIDAQYSFLGLDAPILESLKTYSNSTGERGWAAARVIQKVLTAARQKSIPVVYTQSLPEKLGPAFSSFGRKRQVKQPVGDEANRIVDILEPTENDLVIQKTFASGFAGTPMASVLNTLKADPLIVCGFTTSGCVRAFVVDAHALNYNVFVVEDGTGDRLQISHKVSLLDMNLKYADVITSKECIAYIESL